MAAARSLVFAFLVCLSCLVYAQEANINNGGSSSVDANSYEIELAEENLFLDSTALYTEEEYQDMFAVFRKQYSKTYTPAEFGPAFQNFKRNLNYVTLKNQEKGIKTSFSLALNMYADLTPQAIQEGYTGLNFAAAPPDMPVNDTFADVDVSRLPASVDWRTRNAVTAVYNQGSCGGCWAFAASQALESITAIKTGDLTQLSKQQMIDCSTQNGGCKGGLPSWAFQWILSNGGLASEASYPYRGSQGTCNRGVRSSASLTGFMRVPSYNEAALMAAVAQQPIAIAVQSTQRSFSFYSGGVFDGECGTKYDHAVLLVGYGTDGGKPYWLVKNSWGPSWGERGYIRLARNPAGRGAGKCGITLLAAYPTTKGPMPSMTFQAAPETAEERLVTAPLPEAVDGCAPGQSGFVCYPRNCCPAYRMCHPDIESPVTFAPSGTTCYDGGIVFSNDPKCAGVRC
eukprot:GILK01015236.1.p1 GENE.GILK01015236.1~~GILK01015236.1.p1  ORF type:complete len:456 (-),score=52.29 GILK01015236.1:135-1502(-)